MANAVQATAKKKKMLDQLLALGALKASIVDSADYTYSAGHEFISSVPVGARVATATLSGVTTTAGMSDANDTTFTGVAGDVSEALVLWIDTGYGVDFAVCLVLGFRRRRLSAYAGRHERCCAVVRLGIITLT